MLMSDSDDDEYSLDDEEDTDGGESFTDELSELQREGEMPLNKVLALYGCKEEPKVPTWSPPEEEKTTTMGEDEQSPPSSIPESEEGGSRKELIEVIDLVSPHSTPTPRPMLRSVHPLSAENSSSDSGSDYEYCPGVFWKKKIQVGGDFQATVPEGLSRYDDAPPYENEDRLLWDPTPLTDLQVEEYLWQTRKANSGDGGVHAVPTGCHLRDDEQALYLLLQCGHNREEALRRRRLQSPARTVGLWSEDECRGFESGLKSFGKDFRLIQLERVRTRAIGELVQFYYLWKRTERHDVFACRNRIEKKKYALHPGATDYMDRFLEEQENIQRDRSPTPEPLEAEEEVKTPPSVVPEAEEENPAPEASSNGLESTTTDHQVSSADRESGDS